MNEREKFMGAKVKDLEKLIKQNDLTLIDERRNVQVKSESLHPRAHKSSSKYSLTAKQGWARISGHCAETGKL